MLQCRPSPQGTTSKDSQCQSHDAAPIATSTKHHHRHPHPSRPLLIIVVAVVTVIGCSTTATCRPEPTSVQLTLQCVPRPFSPAALEAPQLQSEELFKSLSEFLNAQEQHQQSQGAVLQLLERVEKADVPEKDHRFSVWEYGLQGLDLWSSGFADLGFVVYEVYAVGVRGPGEFGVVGWASGSSSRHVCMLRRVQSAGHLAELRSRCWSLENCWNP